MTDAIGLIDDCRHYLSIDELCKQIGVNSFELKRVFRQKLNTSVLQYQICKKMQKALTLLQSGNYSVGEVASMTGYESVGSFSNAFQKRFGKRPSELTPD